MSEQEIAGLTNGFLPIPAVSHLGPTAVGVVDLERCSLPSAPDAGEWQSGEGDAVILIRLDGEPLGIVHIAESGVTLDEERLARSLWETTGTRISEHVARFGCRLPIDRSEDLIGGVGSPPDGCKGGRPAVPEGSVAVVLCTAGREEQLRRCLRSLLAQRSVNFELLVIDNRPANGEALRAFESVAGDKRVRYVAEERPGLSIARNRGIGECRADLVAFTDDDVVVDPDWLGWLVSPFGDPAVMATSGLVLPLELRSPSQKRFEQYAGFSRGLERRSYDREGGRGAERLLYPFMGDVFGGGVSMAFRRSELLEIGGFDPALGAGSPTDGGEDIYAFSTMILRGHTTVYEPRSLCWHQHRCDDAGLRRQVFGWGVGLGAVVTKAMGDPRFYGAVARSVPVGLRMMRRRRMAAKSANGSTAPLRRPADLLRIQRRGVVRGPLRYAQGVLRARRMGLR